MKNRLNFETMPMAEVKRLLAEKMASMCMIKYTKKDQTERIAMGTLNPQNYKYDFKGGYNRKNPFIFAYYDVVEYGWRCFDVRRLKEIYW